MIQFPYDSIFVCVSRHGDNDSSAYVFDEHSLDVLQSTAHLNAQFTHTDRTCIVMTSLESMTAELSLAVDILSSGVY